jgi:N utilization substance protein B
MMVLYQEDLVPRGIEAAVAEFEREHGFALPAYARDVVSGVTAERDELDAELERRLTDWRLDRLGAVERAILRMAMWELRGSEVPTEVAIDEAVQLSKRYASPEAAKLVNGVLGAWARDNAGDTGEDT